MNCFQALAGIPPVTERAKELLEDNGNSVAGAVRSVVVGGQEESGIDMVRKQAICLKVLLLFFFLSITLYHQTTKNRLQQSSCTKLCYVYIGH